MSGREGGMIGEGGEAARSGGSDMERAAPRPEASVETPVGAPNDASPQVEGPPASPEDVESGREPPARRSEEG